MSIFYPDRGVVSSGNSDTTTLGSGAALSCDAIGYLKDV